MSQALPRLPLGLSDFAKLREAGANYLYVDKTRALAGMLQAGNYLFLARPRRFGKSLLCSTIASLYASRRDLFDGLAIEPLWDWSQTNPVVHLGLTGVDSSSVESLRESLFKLLADQARPYGITLTGRLLPDDFVTLLRGIRAQIKRRVVVIVDEYEKPVHDHLDDLPAAKRMRDVLAAFYGALKGCDADLEKVFITGIGRMVRTSIFSELNQMKDLTLDEHAAEICGYTEAELRACFQPFIGRLAAKNRLTETQAWDTLRDRYNGYWWGEGEKVYNPWAILNCLDTGKLDNYWWASGTPGMLVELARTLQRPAGDLEGLQATDLSLLFDITQPAPEPLLWQSGYLTVKAVGNRVYTLGFPNAEVREAWFGMMLGHFCGQRGAAGQTAAAVMLAALQTRDRPRFEQALTALFASIPGELQVDREAYYHSVFLAALQAAGGEIAPESRTDKGRADAVLKTADVIYVMEFKLGAAEDALAQIKARRYHEPFLTDPRKLVLLGAGGFAERAIRCLWEEVVRQETGQK
ncbi:MAG: AAA family ATPase [Verrucomicrobiae bacterium]|nr:AAA family ATPase [Verrucomicrobiae bacterium]